MTKKKPFLKDFSLTFDLEGILEGILLPKRGLASLWTVLFWGVLGVSRERLQAFRLHVLATLWLTVTWDTVSSM